jgi:hypothetical protein
VTHAAKAALNRIGQFGHDWDSLSTDVFVGRMRSVVTHGLLSVATLGLYFLVWYTLLNHEMRKHRGAGSHPVLLLLLFLFLPVLGWFLAPMLSTFQLRRIQREAETFRLTNPFYPAVWGLVPVLGWAIAGILLQAGANRAWDRFHRELDRATAGPTTVECPQCLHRMETWINPFATNAIVCTTCGKAAQI